MPLGYTISALLKLITQPNTTLRKIIFKNHIKLRIYAFSIGVENAFEANCAI